MPDKGRYRDPTLDPYDDRYNPWKVRALAAEAEEARLGEALEQADRRFYDMRDDRDRLQVLADARQRKLERAEAEVERLREELADAVDQARLFSRGAMTWLEYDALLVRWWKIANAS